MMSAPHAAIIAAGPLVQKEHWNQSWLEVALPRINNDSTLAEYHRIFADHLTRTGRDLDVLEIGCAASAWLPYFCKYLSCNVFGIDYSSEGIEAARKNLEIQGMTGVMALGDVLVEDDIFDREFDVVTSFGFVEHFRHPDQVIIRMAKYLRKGGLFITGIPNLNGIFGQAIRTFRPDLYAIHNPMDLRKLQREHEKAGLLTHYIAGYVGGLDLKMIASAVVPSSWPRFIRAGISTITHSINPVLCRVAQRIESPSIRRYLAPDILVIYKKA
jgi:2-polyprenyl-3-methyl-5-hydroxy-6-metoxy-1,4-benzoquinol methylase